MAKKTAKEMNLVTLKKTGKDSRANSLDAHVGSRLRMRRSLLGMSQEKLASVLGITFQQVQKYERGVNRVGASRLFDLSQALEVPVQYFFDGLTGGKNGGKRAKLKYGVASGKEAYQAEDNFSDREIMELVRAYKSIKNPEMRRSVLDMIRSLSKKGTLDPA